MSAKKSKVKHASDLRPVKDMTNVCKAQGVIEFKTGQMALVMRCELMESQHLNTHQTHGVIEGQTGGPFKIVDGQVRGPGEEVEVRFVYRWDGKFVE